MINVQTLTMVIMEAGVTANTPLIIEFVDGDVTKKGYLEAIGLLQDSNKNTVAIVLGGSNAGSNPTTYSD